MSGPAALLRGFGSAVGARVAIAALNYGLFWFVSRMLSQEQLGGFSVVMNVFFLVQLLPMLGLATPHIRRIATAPDEVAAEISNAIAFAAPVGVALALIVGLWGQLAYGAALVLPFWLVGLSLLPTSWIVVAEASLVGRERMADIARVNLVESALRTGLAVISIRMGQGLSCILAIFFAMRIATAVFYAWYPALPTPRWSLISSRLQRRNWAEVPVYFGIAAAAALLSRLDLIMLSHFLGLAEAGIYSAASKLYEATQMLPSVLALVIMPSLSRLYLDMKERFAATLAMVVRGVLAIGLGAAIVAAAFAPVVIRLLYKPDMAEAALVLRWLVFASALMVLDVIISSTMLAAQAQKFDLRALVVSLGVLVLSLLGLIPAFGVQGAAAAVVLSYAVRVVVRLRWATKEFGLGPLWPDMLRLLLATCAGMAALNATSDHGPLASALLGLVAYGAVYLIAGGLGRRPLRNLRELRSGLLLLARR